MDAEDRALYARLIDVVIAATAANNVIAQASQELTSAVATLAGEVAKVEATVVAVKKLLEQSAQVSQ